jgi:hypothetical protein
MIRLRPMRTYLNAPGRRAGLATDALGIGLLLPDFASGSTTNVKRLAGPDRHPMHGPGGVPGPA